MKYGKLIIQKKEHELLKNILTSSQYYRDKSYQGSFDKFTRELATSEKLSDRNMPEDVVRFNSMVTIETPWNVKGPYQIVIPEKSNIKSNKISVLAPMGLALFGYAKGDEIEWQFPMGIKIIKILEVVQAKTELKPEEA